MIRINLHGHLKEYGEYFDMDVANPAEAVHALNSQLPGFRETIRKGNWHILRGPIEEGDDVCEESLHVAFGDQTEMHLMPAIEGAGSGGGVFSVIVGAILTVVGVITVNPALIAGGVGMMLGGIIMMTTKVPDTNGISREEVDQQASFLFDKPTNTSNQGVTIPRGYGRMLIGSTVISASLTAEEHTGVSDDLSWISDWATGALSNRWT